jgi:hypothetical protein
MLMYQCDALSRMKTIVNEEMVETRLEPLFGS